MGFWLLAFGVGLLALHLDNKRADRKGMRRFGEGEDGEWLRAAIGAYVVTGLADAAVSDPTPTVEIDVD